MILAEKDDMPSYVPPTQGLEITQNPFANLGGQSSAMPKLHAPLNERPWDLVYTGFFLMHIPATLLLDLQAVYPRS